MPQWMRKHMGEMAWVAKRCASVYRLTPTQEKTIEQVRSIAHQLSTGTLEHSRDNAARAVSLLCAACAEGFSDEQHARCGGRNHWREPCDLIAKMTA